MANITLTLEEYQEILDRIEQLEDKVFKDEDAEEISKDDEIELI